MDKSWPENNTTQTKEEMQAIPDLQVVDIDIDKM